MTADVPAFAVIIARAGSVGLPGKNARLVGGLPMVAHSILHARTAKRLAGLLVSTDCPRVAETARRLHCPVVERPAKLAGAQASVQDAVAHAVRTAAIEAPLIVILYANAPVRPANLIDRAIDALARSDADSVQSYAESGKNHPAWMVTLDDSDTVHRVPGPTIHRRQDLPPMFVPDGGVLVVRRERLLSANPADPHDVLGTLRIGIRTKPGEVIDIDGPADLSAADALLTERRRAAHPPFAIESRPIDEQTSPYVIAEIGVNHDGRRDRLLQLIDAAADAGADAVKTQFFRADLLMGPSARLAAYQARSGATDPHEMIRSLELSLDDLVAFARHARDRNVHPILTIFSESLVEEVAHADFAAWKTASPDIVHEPLLRRLAETGKPLIISTGGAWPEEIAQADRMLEGQPVAFLHCVSAYPTLMRDAALAAIQEVRRMTGRPVGYSDHTMEPITGALAVAAGATILEKHLTWSRDASGPDHAASLDPEGFAQYVRLLRAAHEARGEPTKRVLPCEKEVRLISRQSITAARRIAAGVPIRREDLMICRPGTGLPPDRLGSVIGRSLHTSVDIGTPLTEDDFA